MDFKKLMQYATANQMLTEKKHERQKQRREDEQHEEMIRQVEEERRAARRLKEARAKAEKQRREYKGLADRAAQAKQVPSCSSNPNATSPAVTNATSRKSKTESTGNSSSTVKKKVSNPTTSSKPQKQNQKQQQPSNPTPPGVSTSSKGKMKAPVNFQDLLKIAQKKSGEVAEKEKSSKLIMRDSPPSRGTSPADPGTKPTATGASTSRGSSPVGKSLLERASTRVKKRTHNGMEKAAASSDSLSTVALNNGPVEMAGKGGRNPASVPVENGVYPQGAASLQRRGDVRSTGGTSVVKDRPLQPKAPAQSSASRTHVSQPLSQARQRQRPRPSMNTMKTKSFYGAANAKLATGERPAFRTKHAPMKYTSTWVDEMSDYMQKKGHRTEGEDEEDLYSDEEDEDDLADFVASDDEEELEEGEDYSSAIRQIFGYDKRRFAEERFDDRMMESSYAQQMFEEQRSAKIGRIEDEEDIRREHMELAQKRRKKMGQKPPGGKPLTQTRLRFR